MTEQNQSKAGSNPITCEDFDKLKLKSFGEGLFQIMKKGLSSSIGEVGEKRGWTISLNAAFGNGKTTFLKMFEHFIKTEKKDYYDVIFINAWTSDFYKEPVIAVLSELAAEIEKKQAEIQEAEKSQKKSISIKDMKQAVNGIKGAVGSLASQTIQHRIGVDLEKVQKAYNRGADRASQKEEQDLGEDILNSFEQRKRAVRQMRKAVAEYIKAAGKKLLIIVDELDRARPDYAVHFLEDIKHFFDIEDTAFLVAVNRSQMEASAKRLYGQDMDFNGYYRKFFKQETDLPDPYKEAQRFTDELIQNTKIRFFQKTDGDKTDSSERQERVRSAYLSCKMLGLTLREIEMFIRIFEMILGHEKSIAKWIYVDAYSFFICLFLKEKSMFQSILDKQFTLDDFLKFADEKKAADDSSEKYILNYLLVQTACSFIQRNPDGPTDTQHTTQMLQRQKNKISKGFPEMKGLTDQLISPMEGFHLLDGPPVLKICKTIKECRSVLGQ